MEIVRMTKGNWGKVRAFFDLKTEEGFTIKGFKIVEGISGMFVGFPSEQKDDGTYKDHLYCDKSVKESLNVEALRVYNDPSHPLHSSKGEPTLVLSEKNNTRQVGEEDNIPF